MKCWQCNSPVNPYFDHTTGFNWAYTCAFCDCAWESSAPETEYSPCIKYGRRRLFFVDHSKEHVPSPDCTSARVDREFVPMWSGAMTLMRMRQETAG